MYYTFGVMSGTGTSPAVNFKGVLVLVVLWAFLESVAVALAVSTVNQPVTLLCHSLSSYSSTFRRCPAVLLLINYKYIPPVYTGTSSGTIYRSIRHTERSTNDCGV